MTHQDDGAEGLGEVVLLRPLTDDDRRCPAGTIVGGDACVCAIERLRIDARRNPTSIEAFCLGDYTSCPTWQSEKARLWERDKTPLAERRPRDYSDVRQRVKTAKGRRERAEELMHSDTEEGRRYRARVQAIIDPSRNPFLRAGSSPSERRAALAGYRG